MDDEELNLEAYWEDVRVPPPAKWYEGARTKEGGTLVTVCEPGRKKRKLALRLDVMRHSPSGFEWGYYGSGPAQLALAILLDAYRENGRDWAVRRHQFLKAKLIAGLDRDRPWILTIDDVKKAVRKVEDEHAVGLGDSND